MKNRLAIIMLMGLAIIGLDACSGTSGKDSAKAESAVNNLPMLNIVKTTGERISLREVPTKTVLIFFNPDCDHCQREATQISQQKQAFKNYAVYFISIDLMENITKFASDYDLIEDNFHFGQANFNDVLQSVGPLPTVPSIFIYTDRKLVKRLEGEVKMEEIIRFL